MQNRIVSLATPILIGIIALALGWFAHAAVPLSAQAIVVDGHAALSEPAAPAIFGGLLTYQGRLTDSSGTPINTGVNVVFKLYDRTAVLLWTSSTRSVTPVNGLFTVYLGEGIDPELDELTLRNTASIGVKVGGDAEMTPHQALNTVIGQSDRRTGVVGSSNTGIGVVGTSDSYVGVFGTSRGGFGAGVYASHSSSSGSALEIGNGGIKANFAGVGTNTFAFIHLSAGTNITGNWTLIDNVLTNYDQAAMVFVTHVNNPLGYGGLGFDKAFGVYYNGTHWTIYREDSQAFPPDITFNVMVIKR